jgi:heme exporter protein C
MLKALLGIWMVLVIVGAFLYAPAARSFQQPEAARIMFFHVPNAMVAVVAFLVSVVYAVKYLVGRSRLDDAKSAVSAQLGFLFTVLATLTGALFAQVQWGKAWNWDPRELSIFILLLIYGAYFALRSAVENEESRARLSAVYNIVAFLVMPFLVFVMPRITFSLHPSDTLTKSGNLDMPYHLVLSAAMVGFLGMYIWIFRLQMAIAEFSQKRSLK